MKKAILFKTLIDIFFILHVSVLFILILSLPFDVVILDTNNPAIDQWNMLNWSYAMASILGYFVFLHGLFFLRKMARRLLSKRYFTTELISFLQKSGTHFLIAGGVFLLVELLPWFGEVMGGSISLNLNIYSISPLFLLIIGTFFIIQSHALHLAKNLKEENDLTV